MSKYVNPMRVDSSAVGMLVAAREGKKQSTQNIASLRDQLRNSSISYKSGITLKIIRAKDAQAEFKRMERDALEAIEKRANDLGMTTIKTAKKK